MMFIKRLLIPLTLTGFIFISHFSYNALSMEGKRKWDRKESSQLKLHQRRKENYHSFQEYLNYMESHKEEPKILVVGGGLIYDDLVPGSQNTFSNAPERQKNRLKYYPSSAYLVDLDGLSNIDGQEVETHSDEHFDISQSIDTKFKDKFDIIILEHLYDESLKAETFSNIFSMLKANGEIIFNSPVFNYSTDINEFDWIVQESKESRESKSGSPSIEEKSIGDVNDFINSHLKLISEGNYKGYNIKMYLPKPESLETNSFSDLSDLKFYIGFSILQDREQHEDITGKITDIIQEELHSSNMALQFIENIIYYWLSEKLNLKPFRMTTSLLPPEYWYAQDAGWGYFSIKKSV